MTVTPVAQPTAHRVGRIVGRGWLGVIMPVLVAFVLGAIVLGATGYNPLSVYGVLAEEAFGDWSRIAATLTSATPLLFTGLATALAFRAGVFTLGVEGSFVSGGLVAAVVGVYAGSAPGIVVIPVALLAGLVAGLAVATIPAVLRSAWNVDEVVTTLMLNFVVSGVAGWLVQSALQAPGQANSATEFVGSGAELVRIAPPSQLNAGLILAVLLVVGYGFWMRRTPLGYEFRQVGLNPRFSAAHGIDVRRVVLIAILAAGAVGGLGGAVHTLGVVHRFVAGFSAGFGFTGLAIALLARFHPVGIVLWAVFFGALTTAGSTIQLFSDIPLDIVSILHGSIMIFAVAQFSIGWWARRKAAAR